MAISPIVMAAPFINIVAYVFIAFTSGVEYAVITFVIWLIIMAMQSCASSKTRQLKGKESVYNDER